MFQSAPPQTRGRKARYAGMLVRHCYVSIRSPANARKKACRRNSLLPRQCATYYREPGGVCRFVIGDGH